MCLHPETLKSLCRLSLTYNSSLRGDSECPLLLISAPRLTGTTTHLIVTCSAEMAPHSKYRSKSMLNRPIIMHLAYTLFRSAKICRSFVAGRCPYGDKCTFIHPPPAPFPPSNVLSPFARQLALNWSALPPNSNKLYFMSPQHSIAGAAAYRTPPFLPGQSATGHMAIRPENWRTKPCKHFGRTQGWCPIGDACNLYDFLLMKIR